MKISEIEYQAHCLAMFAAGLNPNIDSLEAYRVIRQELENWASEVYIDPYSEEPDPEGITWSFQFAKQNKHLNDGEGVFFPDDVPEKFIEIGTRVVVEAETKNES